MSFDPPAGTHGGGRPRRSSGPVSRWMARWMHKQHRRKGYKFMGMDVLFLTTIGRKTGERRETAVSWFADGRDAWIIVASATGSDTNPAWYYNIAAHPDQVWIELPQRRLRVTPEDSNVRGDKRRGSGSSRHSHATRNTRRRQTGFFP